MRTSLRLLASLCLAVVAARAEVTLAPLFQDHAVLQRDRPVPVWGMADPGERVSVEFKGQRVGTTADVSGRWIVYLDAIDGSTESSELIVTGKNRLRIADVLVGDVWLASGQSNMEWPLIKTDNAARDIPASDNPLIREFTVKRAVSDRPLTTVEGSWQLASPATSGNFSAVAYYFAHDLQRKWSVPVGIIHTSWGGTPIEAWMSGTMLQDAGLLALTQSRWQADLDAYPERKAAFDLKFAEWTAAEERASKGGPKNTLPRPYPTNGVGSPNTPSGLFNAMLAPLQPYAIRGALWYQGETNAPRAQEYAPLFAAMIKGWRANWGQGDFPFYFVQLANYLPASDTTGRQWAFLREAQTKTLAVPNTGMAVTIDIGNPKDIHPRNKQEVGRRLALIARNTAPDTLAHASGPRFLAQSIEGSTVRIRFSHVSSGLISEKTPPQAFEVAGADRVFYPATAKIAGDTVVLQSPQVPKPVAVRYAWSNAPEVNLYNGSGLPAEPFRTDNW